MLYIVTPTYNRAKELCILYKTLKSQTCLDFKWLVVDDGSTDETPLLIAKFQEDSCFAIDYLKKDNGGKHTAYNLALDYMSKIDCHIVVDSDDWLAMDAVEKILQDLEKTSNKEIGIVYPKYGRDSSPQWLSDNVKYVSIPDIKLKYGLSIETAIVIKNLFSINRFAKIIYNICSFSNSFKKHHIIFIRNFKLPRKIVKIING